MTGCYRSSGAKMLLNWRGQTVFCIASGPSLTADDCALVRGTGCPTVVTNTTFRLCDWATVLYGFDRSWWRLYIDEISKVFAGMKVCESLHYVRRDVRSAKAIPEFQPFGNSGASAISLAIAFGARRLIMLGYDCQKTDGKTHHHGDHPAGLQNCDSLPNWPERFARLSRYAQRRGAEVINASRVTALECFQRQSLRECL